MSAYLTGDVLASLVASEVGLVAVLAWLCRRVDEFVGWKIGQERRTAARFHSQRIHRRLRRQRRRQLVRQLARRWWGQLALSGRGR